MIKLCGLLVTHNEHERGFLERCLKNLYQYCDWIVVYDDYSTDGSQEVIKRYTPFLIEGKERINFPTLPHKQKVLDYIKQNDEINPDWIIWLDADEILDKNGTENIRDYLSKLENNITSIDLHEVNLWRSNCWKRLDSLFDAGWFKRCWKYSPSLSMANTKSLHPTPYPTNLIGPTQRATFEVIHFGFASDESIVRKIRNYRALGRAKPIYDRYLNEKALAVLEDYQLINYPEHAKPEREDNKPTPLEREEWREKIGKEII